MRILVVEDRPENIESAKALLSKLGHEVTVVTGYDQAHNELKLKLNLEVLKKKLAAIELPEDFSLGQTMSDGYTNIIWKSTSEMAYTNPENTPKEKLPGLSKAYEEIRQAEYSSKEVAYDVVLTDVMFPKGGYQCMSEEGKKVVRQQGDMPYGPVVALRALSLGIKRVGILTQGSHHDDPFVFAFDGLKGFSVGDIHVVCANMGYECYVERETMERVKMPDYNDRAAYEPFRKREKAGEVVFVKDWEGLLNAVLAEQKK